MTCAPDDVEVDVLRIESIELKRLSMEFKEPFVTAVGREVEKDFYVVTLRSGNLFGYGECGATNTPFYVEETNCSVRYISETLIAPRLLNAELAGPDDFGSLVNDIRRNNMAKAMFDMAVWDLFSKSSDMSLSKYMGGVKPIIECGISIGIQPDVQMLIGKVGDYLDQGFRRIKIKIRPGEDLVPLRAIRWRYPEAVLMADANSAYSLEDVGILKAMDELNLAMIEQPLRFNDIYQHSLLANEIATPICLDESLTSLDDVIAARELNACSVVNAKAGRFGGISETLQVQRYCSQSGMTLWCGGLLESGIGRLANLAVSSLAGFDFPGDIGPSSRYFKRDLLKNPIEFSSPGIIEVPTGPGLGEDPDLEYLETITKSSIVLGEDIK